MSVSVSYQSRIIVCATFKPIFFLSLKLNKFTHSIEFFCKSFNVLFYSNSLKRMEGFNWNYINDSVKLLNRKLKYTINIV